MSRNGRSAAGRVGLAVTCLVLLTGCAHRCPELVDGPEAPEEDPPRPCGPIEACVFGFWLGETGTPHAATPSTPLGEAPSRHTGWAPGELQRWRELAQVASTLLQKDPEFVRELTAAESEVRRRFEREAHRLQERCKQPPGKRALRRLGQGITEEVYERAGIYRTLREHHGSNG